MQPTSVRPAPGAPQWPRKSPAHRVRGQPSIFRHELLGDLPRKGPIDTALHVDLGKPSNSNAALSRSSLRSRARSACSVSDCELTDTYSPAAIDMAPATSPATPAIKTASALRPPRRRRRSGWRSRRCHRWRRDCGPQPPNAVDKVVFGVQAKPAHEFPSIARLSSTKQSQEHSGQPVHRNIHKSGQWLFPFVDALI